MVKFKRPSDKILLQRITLLGIVGVISCGILNGYFVYHGQVSEYMRSMGHRQPRESNEDYRARLMRSNQRLATKESGSSTVRSE